MRRTVGDDAPGVEQHHAVGVLRRQREVVHRRDEGEPGLRPQRVEELERLLLVPDVEGRGRLVEEDDAGLLRKRAGDDDALLLATAERAETTLAIVEEVEARRARAPPPRGRAFPPSRAVRDAASVRAARTRATVIHGRRRRLLGNDGQQT